MEEPKYADISDAELQEIEAELGHPVTQELALWFIRNRTNRTAVERMLKANDANRVDTDDAQNVQSLKKAQKPVLLTNKVRTKCA